MEEFSNPSKKTFCKQQTPTSLARKGTRKEKRWKKKHEIN